MSVLVEQIESGQTSYDLVIAALSSPALEFQRVVVLG